MKSAKTVKRIFALIMCAVVLFASAYAIALAFHHHTGSQDNCPICHAIALLNNSVQFVLSGLFLFFLLISLTVKKLKNNGKSSHLQSIIKMRIRC